MVALQGAIVGLQEAEVGITGVYLTLQEAEGGMTRGRAHHLYKWAPQRPNISVRQCHSTFVFGPRGPPPCNSTLRLRPCLAPAVAIDRQFLQWFRSQATQEHQEATIPIYGTTRGTTHCPGGGRGSPGGGAIRPTSSGDRSFSRKESTTGAGNGRAERDNIY